MFARIGVMDSSGHRRLAASAAVGAAIPFCLLSPSAFAMTTGPTLPLGHSGRWIVDSTGRVVVMHGTNLVYKLAPYYPAAAGFGASDARFLQSIGFNVVRVGVIFQALEPMPGVFDQGYLNHIA